MPFDSISLENNGQRGNSRSPSLGDDRRKDRQITKCRQLESELPEEVLVLADEMYMQEYVARHAEVALLCSVGRRKV